MYLYSYLAQPIFGPPRYHLYHRTGVPDPARSRPEPVARGDPLAGCGRCGWFCRSRSSTIYSQAVKADWRGLAAWLMVQESQSRAGDSPERSTIVVHPSDPRFPREQLEAARYYLSPRFRVVRAGESPRAPGIERIRRRSTTSTASRSRGSSGASEPDEQ